MGSINRSFNCVDLTNNIELTSLHDKNSDGKTIKSVDFEGQSFNISIKPLSSKIIEPEADAKKGDVSHNIKNTSLQATSFKILVKDSENKIVHERTIYITSRVTSKDKFFRKAMLIRDNQSQFIDILTVGKHFIEKKTSDRHPERENFAEVKGEITSFVEKLEKNIQEELKIKKKHTIVIRNKNIIETVISKTVKLFSFMFKEEKRSLIQKNIDNHEYGYEFTEEELTLEEIQKAFKGAPIFLKKV